MRHQCKTKMIIVTLNGNEEGTLSPCCLFLPSGWFHTIKNIDLMALKNNEWIELPLLEHLLKEGMKRLKVKNLLQFHFLLAKYLIFFPASSLGWAHFEPSTTPLFALVICTSHNISQSQISSLWSNSLEMKKCKLFIGFSTT